MKKLGIPYPIAVAGVHYDNWKSSFLSKGPADSLDDQYSIALGYSGGNKTQSLVNAALSVFAANLIINSMK